jgi:hypothetical protein
MSAPNPYAPPEKPIDPYAGADSADLFVAMQPTLQVRAAGMASILAGVACLFVTVQFVIGALAATALVILIEGLLTLLGLAYFVVAWGVVGARGWASVVGIVLSLVTGAALAFVLLASGALSTVMAGAASLAALVLLAVSFSDVQRMARARAAMHAPRLLAPDAPR